MLFPPRSFAAPPDGGWGWVVTVASFAVNFVIIGTTYSFGVLLSALVADPSLLAPGSHAAGAWVGSINIAVMMGCGSISSALLRAHGTRPVCALGGVIVGVALCLSSWAPSVGVLYLTYGLLGGIGMSLSWISSLVVVSQYFTSRRALATGVAVAGSGVGTFASATLNARLIEQFGWRASLRVDAAVCFTVVVLAALTFVPVTPAVHASGGGVASTFSALRSSSTPPPAGNPSSTATAATEINDEPYSSSSHIDKCETLVCVDEGPVAPHPASEPPLQSQDQAQLSGGAHEASSAPPVAVGDVPGECAVLLSPSEIYSSRPFAHFMASAALAGVFISVTLQHLPVFLAEQGHSHDTTVWIVAATGLASSCGRVVFGRLADLEGVDSVLLLQGCLTAAAAAIAGLAVFGGQISYVCTFVVVYGACSGAFNAMGPPIYADVMGVLNMPTVLGASFSVQPPVMLVASPLAAWSKHALGSYTVPWLVVAAATCGSAAALTGLPRKLSDWYIPAGAADSSDLGSRLAACPTVATTTTCNCGNTDRGFVLPQLSVCLGRLPTIAALAFTFLAAAAFPFVAILLRRGGGASFSWVFASLTGHATQVLDTPSIMARDAELLCNARFGLVIPALAKETHMPAPTDRLVIAHAINGLADSLMGTSSSLYVALLSGAHFYADWGDDSRRVRWEDAFSAPNVNWSLSSLPLWAQDPEMVTDLDVDTQDSKCDHIGKEIRSGGPLSLFKGRPVLGTHTFCSFAKWEQEQSVVNESVWEALGISAAGADGCALSFIFRPLPDVFSASTVEFSRVLRAREAGDVIVAIHIRAGAQSDKSFHNELPGDALRASFYDGFWACAEQIGADLSAVREAAGGLPHRILWILATDVDSIREEAIDRFGPERVVTRASLHAVHVRLNGVSSATTPADMKDTVAEFWLLSLADAFVLSDNSGFGRLASVLRNQVLGVRPTFALDATKKSAAEEQMCTTRRQLP